MKEVLKEIFEDTSGKICLLACAWLLWIIITGVIISVYA